MNPALTESLPSIPVTNPHHKNLRLERVRIVDGGVHQEKDGKVVDICFGSTKNDYKIALDKESHSQEEVTVTVPHFHSYPDEAVAILDPGSGAMEQS